ncbi:MAG: transcription antitermination factor NusB [Bacteroidota bacterium]
MASQPLLNRRFVRTQAVQQLYAFYVCRHANYEGAIAQIKATFTPDVFADSPVDPAQLAQATQQAQDLFNASLANSSSPSHADSRINTAVKAALAGYKKELTNDTRKLEQGLSEAVKVMSHACVRIWQLLIEWAHLDKKQAEKPKLSPGYVGSSAGHLSESLLLQRLQNESSLAELVKQEKVSWDAHRPLAENWYHQLVKKAPLLQDYIDDPASTIQLSKILVDKIIFGQEAIQDFFEELDLNWAIHKRLVKKWVRQSLASLEQNSEKGLTLKTFGAVDQWEEAQHFYTDLVNRTLQKDEELEALMAQKSDNWAVDRIMLLDKTVIKLALCEMLYFPSIPVKVSMNEYIDIAKTYSVSKSSQFVNGLLDAVASTLQAKDVAQKA